MPAASHPHGDRPARAGAPTASAGGRKGRRDRVVAAALGLGFDQLVRRGLRGIWVRGDLPPGPVVLAVNHHSWWDAFVVLAVLRRRHRAGTLIMAAENLSKFAFLRTLGVVSERELRSAIGAARSGRVLVLFPEGELRPPGPTAPLAPGAAWLARRTPADLVVAAIRVTMRGHQSPEAFVSLVRCPADPGEPATTLASAVSELDADVLAADPQLPPPGFDRLVEGRRDWDERLQAMARVARR